MSSYKDQLGSGSSFSKIKSYTQRKEKLSLSIEEKKVILKKLLFDKDSVFQYGSPAKIYQYLRQKYPQSKFTLQQIKDYVFQNLRSKRIVRNIHKRKFNRLPYRNWGYGELVQADLLFMPGWNRQNV